MTLATLQNRYPWPAEMPDVPENCWGWLHDSTRSLLDRYLSGRACRASNQQARLVVELGSWLGQSALHIVRRLPRVTLICIDHWAGSPEHCFNPQWSALLPTLYETFQRNLWPYRRRVIPLRADTLDGLAQVARAGLVPDLVYLDATHTTERVRAELDRCDAQWPSAVLVGDDYNNPDVRRAADQFAIHSRRNLIHNAVAFALEPRL